jgi:hypothetical protein
MRTDLRNNDELEKTTDRELEGPKLSDLGLNHPTEEATSRRIREHIR